MKIKTLITTQSNNKRPVPYDFLQGQAVVYSNQAPHKHSGNEDSAAMISIGDGAGVLAVADGVGGLPAGGQASELTVNELAGELQNDADQASRAAILNAIERANEKLLSLRSGTATTLCVLEVNGMRVRPYHVGDSVILIIGQRGVVKLQTLSHSPTGYGVAAGFINEEQALLHDDRHIISNMVGANDMRIEIGAEFELAPRDTVMLASDGLFDNLLTEEVIAIIRKGSLIAAATHLAAVARNRMRRHSGKPDDLTFILYRTYPKQ